MYTDSSQATAELLSILAAERETLQLFVDLGNPEVDIERKYKSLPDAESLVDTGLIAPAAGGYRLTEFGQAVRGCVLEITDFADCFETVTAVAPILPGWDEHELFPDMEALGSVEVVQGRAFEPDRPRRRLVEAITDSETTPIVANMSAEEKNQLPEHVDPEFVSIPSDLSDGSWDRLRFAVTSSGGYLYIWAGEDRPLEESVLLAGAPEKPFTAWVTDQIADWRST